MTPKEYRKAFGVPSKTLSSPKYSEAKRKIAQDKGLATKLAEGRKKKAGSNPEISARDAAPFAGRARGRDAARPSFPRCISTGVRGPIPRYDNLSCRNR